MKMLRVLPLFLLLIACGSEPVPKPKGYFRIDLPEQVYVEVPTPCDIRFEIPTYSKLALKSEDEESCFMDVVFPEMKAKLHLTYKPIKGDLRQLITDVQGFKSTHQVKANRIQTDRIERDSSRVFGNLYEVDGDVASPAVFFLTDSTDHFLYGALYFSVLPNGDSLAPVSAQLREDIRRMTATLRWP